MEGDKNFILFITFLLVIPLISSTLNVGIGDDEIGLDLIPAPPINYSTIATVNDTTHFGGYTVATLTTYLQGLYDLVYCELTGCTMAGDIDMGTNDINNINNVNILNDLDVTGNATSSSYISTDDCFTNITGGQCYSIADFLLDTGGAGGADSWASNYTFYYNKSQVDFNFTKYLKLTGGTLTGVLNSNSKIDTSNEVEAEHLHSTDDVEVADKVYHSGDTDTYLSFTPNLMYLTTGGTIGITIDSGSGTVDFPNLDVTMPNTVEIDTLTFDSADPKQLTYYPTTLDWVLESIRYVVPKSRRGMTIFYNQDRQQLEAINYNTKKIYKMEMTEIEDVNIPEFEGLVEQEYKWDKITDEIISNERVRTRLVMKKDVSFNRISGQFYNLTSKEIINKEDAVYLNSIK